MFKFFRDIIDSLENSKVPFIYFILTFIFVVSLRNFIELFSDTDTSQISLEQFFHYDITYISLAMLLILIFYIATKKDIFKIMKVITTSFVILNLAPILDLILSLGKGFNLSFKLSCSLFPDKQIVFDSFSFYFWDNRIYLDK